jgi:hypothetical protein
LSNLRNSLVLVQRVKGLGLNVLPFPRKVGGAFFIQVLVAELLRRVAHEKEQAMAQLNF